MTFSEKIILFPIRDTFDRDYQHYVKLVGRSFKIGAYRFLTCIAPNGEEMRCLQFTYLKKLSEFVMPEGAIDTGIK